MNQLLPLKRLAPRAIFAALALSTVAGTGLAMGCARPNEVGWTPVYSTRERWNQITRAADLDGKMMQDDIDYHLFMWRPMSGLTYWHVAQHR